jgi:hypothetical protein
MVCNKSWSKDNNKSSHFQASTDNSTQLDDNNSKKTQNRHGYKNQKNNIKIQTPTSLSRSFNKKWKGPVSTSTKQSTAYITIKGIQSETSYQEPDWPVFAMKELMDNAYDFLNDYLLNVSNI